MDNLQSNPWFLLAITVGVAIGIIFFGTTQWPNLNEKEEKIAKLIDQIGELTKEVEEGRALQRRLPELQKEIKAKEEELEQLKKILPPDSKVEDLVRKLERLAVDSRLLIKNWSSKRRIARDFYYEWPIAVSASGQYHNLAKFYAQIGNYSRIINIAGLRITQAANKSDPDATINASFTATTYVYREDK